jgi:hypothetical protein
MPTLYHNTDQTGLAGILASGRLLPSTRQRNPRDVRYGDGQYLSDIPPGTMSGARLSRALVGHPFAGRRFTRYVAIEVTGLPVVACRTGVYLIPGRRPLDVTGRVVGNGVN